jgi:hypothetical protein
LGFNLNSLKILHLIPRFFEKDVVRISPECFVLHVPSARSKPARALMSG